MFARSALAESAIYQFVRCFLSWFFRQLADFTVGGFSFQSGDLLSLLRGTAFLLRDAFDLRSSAVCERIR